ncbi:hypothetical protein DFJ74DRAFT_678693 [Hyaloraphidium curvatum]|nr:hypothetical protein DFJ74DRAFT_678693 [Hyaloraphidium curvatum]
MRDSRAPTPGRRTLSGTAGRLLGPQAKAWRSTRPPSAWASLNPASPFPLTPRFRPVPGSDRRRHRRLARRPAVLHLRAEGDRGQPALPGCHRGGRRGAPGGTGGRVPGGRAAVHSAGRRRPPGGRGKGGRGGNGTATCRDAARRRRGGGCGAAAARGEPCRPRGRAGGAGGPARGCCREARGRHGASERARGWGGRTRAGGRLGDDLGDGGRAAGGIDRRDGQEVRRRRGEAAQDAGQDRGEAGRAGGRDRGAEAGRRRDPGAAAAPRRRLERRGGTYLGRRRPGRRRTSLPAAAGRLLGRRAPPSLPFDLGSRPGAEAPAREAPQGPGPARDSGNDEEAPLARARGAAVQVPRQHHPRRPQGILRRPQVSDGQGAAAPCFRDERVQPGEPEGHQVQQGPPRVGSAAGRSHGRPLIRFPRRCRQSATGGKSMSKILAVHEADFLAEVRLSVPKLWEQPDDDDAARSAQREGSPSPAPKPRRRKDPVADEFARNKDAGVITPSRTRRLDRPDYAAQAYIRKIEEAIKSESEEDSGEEDGMGEGAEVLARKADGAGAPDDEDRGEEAAREEGMEVDTAEEGEIRQ